MTNATATFETLPVETALPVGRTNGSTKSDVWDEIEAAMIKGNYGQVFPDRRMDVLVKVHHEYGLSFHKLLDLTRGVDPRVVRESLPSIIAAAATFEHELTRDTKGIGKTLTTDH